MSRATRLDLRTLRSAAVTDAGAVVPLPCLTIGTLSWPWEHAHRVLHEWREWTASAADLASTARLVRSPRGRATVAIELAVAGEPWRAAGGLAPLRAARARARHRPRRRARRPAPGGLPPSPPGTSPVSAHRRLAALPPAAVDAFVAAAGPGSGSELLSAELHHLGGAYVLAAVGAAADADPDGAERVRIGLAALERRLGALAPRLTPAPGRAVVRRHGRAAGDPRRPAAADARHDLRAADVRARLEALGRLVRQRRGADARRGRRRAAARGGGDRRADRPAGRAARPRAAAAGGDQRRGQLPAERRLRGRARARRPRAVREPGVRAAGGRGALGMAIDLARGIGAADRAMRAGREATGWSPTRARSCSRAARWGSSASATSAARCGGCSRPFGCPVRVYDPWLPELAIRREDAEPVGARRAAAALARRVRVRRRDERQRRLPRGARAARDAGGRACCC